MGYEGAKLAPMFSATPSRIMARRMAEHGAEHLRLRVAESTPIDSAPQANRAPGTARAAWRVKPVVGPVTTLSEEVYTTGVETFDPVARLLEFGTGVHGPHHRPFVIRPTTRGGELRFYSRRLGRWVFARSVLNPGMRARRPLATGAALAEAELAAVLLPDLMTWVFMVEAHARAQV